MIVFYRHKSTTLKKFTHFISIKEVPTRHEVFHKTIYEKKTCHIGGSFSLPPYFAEKIEYLR
jgi:hypothetical protein